jgi:hyaluronan synthase
VIDMAETMFLAYMVLVSALIAKFLWFMYYFSLYTFPSDEYKEEYKVKTALVVPIYNEDPEHLKNAIESIKNADGLDYVYLVNDGSNKVDIGAIVKPYVNEKYIYVDLPKNVGKREAQYYGIIGIPDDVEVVVFMDSDTIIEKNSITELVKPLINPEIGGVSGQVLVKNSNDNFVTKCTSAMMWSGSNIWKQASSNMGFIQVTSGALGCYRLKYINALLPNYINQYFLGTKCSMSDDRWITHHIQTDIGKRVIYQKSAIAYTYVPTTFKATYKMLLRWKMGALRETLLILARFRSRPMLVTDVWLNFISLLSQLILRIILYITIIFQPYIIFIYVLGIVFMSGLFSLHMLFENRKEFKYRIYYSILNEIYYWLVFPEAILKIRHQSRWTTR